MKDFWIVPVAAFAIASVFGYVISNTLDNIETRKENAVNNRIAYLEGRVDALSVRIDNLEKED